MRKHLANAGRWTWVVIGTVGAILAIDMRAAIRNADSNIHDILTNAGLDSAPRKLATYIWTKPLISFFVFVFIIILFASILRAMTKLLNRIKDKHSDFVDTRNRLADECDKIARGILSLVADHHNMIQSAWHADMETSYAARFESGENRPLTTGVGHSNAVARLNTIYGDRYAQDAWRVIYEASQIMTIRESDVWPLSRTVVDYNLMPKMATLLTKIAAGLRTERAQLSDPANQGDRPI